MEEPRRAAGNPSELSPLHLCRDGSIVEDPNACSRRGGVKAVLPGSSRLALSKRMAGLLRHYPHRYGLSLDKEGWARIRDLVEALHRMGLRWVEEWHVRGVAEHDPKGRYQLVGDMIRARYGHSIRIEGRYEEAVNPPPLYHGTPVRNLQSILARGLMPGRRLYVHLSATREDALETGKRHGSPVAILKVDPACLRNRQVKVYKATDRVYLARWVPPECIEVEEVTG